MTPINILLFSSSRDKAISLRDTLKFHLRRAGMIVDFDIEAVPTLDDFKKTLKLCGRVDILNVANETDLSLHDLGSACKEMATELALKRFDPPPFVILRDHRFLSAPFRTAGLRTKEGWHEGTLDKVMLQRIEEMEPVLVIPPQH